MDQPLMSKQGFPGGAHQVQSVGEDAFFGPMHHWLAMRPQRLSCCNQCGSWCKSLMGCPYTIPLFISDQPKQKSSEMDGAIEVPCNIKGLLGPCGFLAPCLAPNPVVKIPSRRLMTDTKYNCNLCAPNVLTLSTPGGARVDVHELPWVFIELFLPGSDQPAYRTGLPMECGLPSQGCINLVDQCNDTYYKTYRRRALKIRTADFIHDAVLYTPQERVYEGNIFAFVDSKYALPSTIFNKICCCPKVPQYATENSEGVKVTTHAVTWTDSLNKNVETNSDLALGMLSMYATSMEGLGNGSMLYLNPCFHLKYGLCMKYVKDHYAQFWDDSDAEYDFPRPKNHQTAYEEDTLI